MTDETQRSSPIVDVTMLGPSGAGKTSLLTSMYEQFGQVVGHRDLELSPVDEQTAHTLEDYRSTLRRLTASNLVVEEYVEGTSKVRDYTFGLGRKARRFSFVLRFTDYPGGFLTDASARAGEGPRQQVRRALEQSRVILLAIDTPAMIEHSGRYHDEFNHPTLMFEEVKRILRANDESKLIILAPLKCEKYVATRAGAQDLVRRVRLKYRPLIEHLGGGDLRGRVGCVLTPVQTVGSIKYFKVDDTGENPIFYYRKTRPDAEYAPVDTDQPLRYLLRFVFGAYRREERSGLRTLVERLTGTDRRLVEAVEDFSKGCRTDGGFEVVQTHRFLN